MNYVSNIDTIYILIYIANYENSASKILSYLAEEKEKAKLTAISNALSKHTISINGMTFELLPNGTGNYAYILHNNGYEVNIAQFQPSISNFSPIRIRISSDYLWAYGISQSWGIIYNWITETFGNIEIDKVSRVDLCSHVSDIDFITNYDTSYKGNFKNKQTFYSGNNINCITFGSRKNKNIYCRIYNKTLEIREKRHKTWFLPIWQENKLNIDNVWNVEFELKSELLRSLNVISVNDTINHLQDLWKYCTCQWLQKIDRTNKKTERCNINANWINIQNNFDNFSSIGLIERKKQIQLDASILVPSIAGNITSYSARNNKINMTEALDILSKDIKKYLHNKNTSFEKEVKNKQSILHDCEVTQYE